MTMHSAIQTFLNHSCRRPGVVLSTASQEMSRFSQLFLKQYGMEILLDESERFTTSYYGSVTGNKLLTDESVRSLRASQSIPFSGWSFDTRFEIAMRSNGWPAETFLDFLRCDDPLHLVEKTMYAAARHCTGLRNTSFIGCPLGWQETGSLTTHTQLVMLLCL